MADGTRAQICLRSGADYEYARPAFIDWELINAVAKRESLDRMKDFEEWRQNKRNERETKLRGCKKKIQPQAAEFQQEPSEAQEGVAGGADAAAAQ